MLIDNSELLIDELRQLEQEHRDLNILTDNNGPGYLELDQLTAQRFKKRKLFLKDRIAHIRSMLYPDIIA